MGNVMNKSMDEIDHALSIALLDYCEWNCLQGLCKYDDTVCQSCCANQLLDIVFNGDRDLLGIWPTV